jgi:predicted DNA-binding antitoxin AbrB/MazE fold protein
LPASNRYTVNYDFPTGVITLSINEAQMNDVGNYTVLADNEVGSDQTSCNAFINQLPNIDSTPMINPDAFRFLEHPTGRAPASREDIENLRPPKVIIPLTDVRLEEGQSVQLACKIEGYPRPKVSKNYYVSNEYKFTSIRKNSISSLKLTWFKDSAILPASTRYTCDYDLNTNVVTLRIDHSLLHDLGSYVVLAENDAGRDQTFCTVFIQEMPNIDQTPMVNPEAFRYLENPPLRKMPEDEGELLEPPVVIIPLQDLQLKEGEAVLLVCKIEGKPPPKVSSLKFCL